MTKARGPSAGLGAGNLQALHAFPTPQPTLLHGQFCWQVLALCMVPVGFRLVFWGSKNISGYASHRRAAQRLVPAGQAALGCAGRKRTHVRAQEEQAAHFGSSFSPARPFGC